MFKVGYFYSFDLNKLTVSQIDGMMVHPHCVLWPKHKLVRFHSWEYLGNKRREFFNDHYHYFRHKFLDDIYILTVIDTTGGFKAGIGSDVLVEDLWQPTKNS